MVKDQIKLQISQLAMLLIAKNISDIIPHQHTICKAQAHILFL
jgi:molybdenum cofactor biosynthesis enzyme